MRGKLSGLEGKVSLRQQYDKIAEQRDVSSIQKAEEIRARYADVSSRASFI